MTSFTKEQEKAIYDSNIDILVSASAGSGKTTVLVERVIEKILHHQSIENLLIITFTKAAASEMKLRIKNAIKNKIKEQPDNLFLKQQLAKVDIANISTIDSFCLEVIRKFYYVINLDPNFSIMTDDTQLSLLKEKALLNTEKYFFENKDQEFIDFYNNFAGDREVEAARSMLLELYYVTLAQPNYEAFLKRLDFFYQIDINKNDIISSNLWQEKIKPLLLTNLQNIINKISQYIAEAEHNFNDLNKLIEQLNLFMKSLNYLLAGIEQNLNYDEIRSRFSNCKFVGRLRRSSNWDESSTNLYQEISEFKAKCQDQLKKLFASFFITDEKEQLELLAKAQKLVKTISKVELTFINEFGKLKRKNNIIDFNDMEQFAYKILTSNSNNSDLARSYYQNKFSEILVDEYQDVNELQEQIIQVIKEKGKNNLFMVGDVKQSIYGFRQAQPHLFLQKYHQFSNEVQSERIILSDNFRSSKNVTQIVNNIFDALLTENFGGINYQKEGRLQYGATYYPDDLGTSTEFIFSTSNDDKPSITDEEEEVNDLDEINLVITRIKKLFKDDYQVYDVHSKLKRSIKFSDIAILTRTKSENLKLFQAFANAKLPLFVSDIQNYFKAFELVIITNYLKIIDNPQQDIPLVSVMRSPLYGFTEPEFAKIRIASRSTSFYDAIINYIQTSDDELSIKCNNFINELSHFRNFSIDHRISELICDIFQNTHIIELVSGMVNGPQRRVNLESLYERAQAFETSGFKGLYQFINFIKRMQKNKYDFSQPLSSKDAQDAIKLMTIHGSKGLEFPIVFLIGLNHKYQQADTTNNYVITTKSGLGLTITTADYRIDSLVKSYCNFEKKLQNLEEEIRILYVGLTRAKQKLIMVSTMANENIIPDFQNKLDAHNQLPFIDKSNAISPMSFLGPELFAHQVNTLCLSDIDRELDKEDKVHYIQVMQLKSQASVQISNQSRSDLSGKLLATVKTLYNFNYPFQAATTTTSYQAVSEIKKAFEYPNDKESDNSKLINSANKYLMPISDQPAFLKKANFTGAEIGTAMHLLLQYYDYTIEYSPTNVDDLIENLVLQNKLNPDIIPHLSKHDINWFVTSNFAKAFWEKSDNLYREIEFSSLISANNLFHNFNDVNDKILVHGTIDGYFIDDDGIILFDYKTDFVDRSNLELAINNLKKKYAGQLSLYASALNNLSDKKVKAKYLILLSINKIVKVD